jgi:hypothetical protein
MKICEFVSSTFPKLFGFENCVCLFMDHKANLLYKILYNVTDPANDTLSKSNQEKDKDFDPVVVLPTNAGCTGQSIQDNKIEFFNPGELRRSAYLNEVDNSDNVKNV